MNACTDGGDASCDVLVICEDWSARWCPVCGDCTCPCDEAHGWGPGVFDDGDWRDEECPLHGDASSHAKERHR